MDNGDLARFDHLLRLTMTVSERPIHEGNKKSTTFDLQRHCLRPNPPNSFLIKGARLEREKLIEAATLVAGDEK